MNNQNDAIYVLAISLFKWSSHDSCSFCYKYNVARNDNIYKFMLSSIISSCGNSFLFLFSEIMDYEVSEISKELSKKKEKSQKNKENHGIRQHNIL